MKTVFPSFLSAVDRLSWFLLALFTSWIVLGSADIKQTNWPLHSNKPVLFIWNAPTQHCEKEKSVKLSLDQFDIVSNPSKDVAGQILTTFYKENLGIYPYYNPDETAVNGGLPQNANLSKHLKKMSEDIDQYIPDRKAKGLTVIEWEEWSPFFYRNKGPRRYIYRWKTEDPWYRKNPNWTPEQLGIVAKPVFEHAAREFLLGTLKQGKNLRPNQLWGYYLFIECFNYEYHEPYTGQCRDVQIQEDNDMKWLWYESTALFPEIYLDSHRGYKNQGRLFVQKRVQHAMRLASVGDGLARPVFVFTKPYYKDDMKLLTEKDLVNTIGESVALGAAGVIFWGTTSYATSKGCKDLNNYIEGAMGRYLLNVTKAAKDCSQKLCNFKGRCLRREPDSTVYLHLSPSTHSIISESGKLKVTGSPGEAELEAFRQHFKCQCYNGTEGENCKLEGQGGTDGIEEIEETEEREEGEKGEKGEREEKEETGEKGERGQSSATSVSGMWPLCFVLQLGLLSLFH